MVIQMMPEYESHGGMFVVHNKQKTITNFMKINLSENYYCLYDCGEKSTAILNSNELNSLYTFSNVIYKMKYRGGWKRRAYAKRD